MQILFVVDSLAPGGTEQSTLQTAPLLRERGIEICFVTLKDAEHDLTDQARSSGFEVIQLRRNSPIGQVRELRRLIKRRAPDLVHTALFTADQVGRIATLGTGIPVVSSFVNTPYDPARLTDPNVRRWKLRLVQLIDATTGRFLVDRFHSVSEGVSIANAAALRIPPSRIIVAERGRDATTLGDATSERRGAIRRSLAVAPDAPLVLSIGRQEHQKGQRVLVDVVDRLLPHCPEITVLIAGKEGSATAALYQALDEHPEAAAHIRLLGHRTDVGDLLAAADVLVITSMFEGTAGVALEALASGVPIVSHDLQGLRGVLLHDATAILCPVGEPARLAEALRGVLADPGLGRRLGTNGRRDFERRFTLQASADRMAGLYRTVLNGSLAGRRTPAKR